MVDGGWWGLITWRAKLKNRISIESRGETALKNIPLKAAFTFAASAGALSLHEVVDATLWVEVDGRVEEQSAEMRGLVVFFRTTKIGEPHEARYTE